MTKSWLFFENPFYNAVKRNYKKGLKISTYTFSQLSERQADAFFGPLFTMYSPLHQALAEAYNTWKTEGGSQKGATLTFDQLLALLSPTKLNAWEVAVMGIYAKGTPGYVSIFPNGHKPFQKGEKDQRVAAVKQLGDALSNDGGFVATAKDVNNFYQQLIAARTGQQGKLGNTGANSSAVNTAVQNAMVGLYKVLGACISRFADDMTQAEGIFDLETIRNHDQLIFTGKVKLQQTKLVMVHTFAGDDKISLTNDGKVALNFYMSKEANDAAGTNTVITVSAGETKEVTANDFGNIEHTFLQSQNLDALAEGHFKVEL